MTERFPGGEVPLSGRKYLRQIHLTHCYRDDLLTDSKEFVAIVDVYAVLDAFAVTCPARQQAIKKLLCSGLRGKGSESQDLQEARDAVTRAIQMQANREDRSEMQGMRDE